MVRRVRVDVYLPPITAYYLAKLAVALGVPPSRAAAKIISTEVKKYAKKFSAVSDDDDVEDLLVYMPDYLSKSAAERVVKMDLGDDSD